MRWTALFPASRTRRPRRSAALVLVGLLANLLPVPGVAGAQVDGDEEPTAVMIVGVSGPLGEGRCFQEVYATWPRVEGALRYGVTYVDALYGSEGSSGAAPNQNGGASRGLTAPSVGLTGLYGPCEAHPNAQPGRFVDPRGTVTLPRVRPTAAFTATVDGATVRFDASSSTPAPDGAPLIGHTWHFGDGATADGVVAEHTYAEPGTFTVTLIVTDERERGDVAQQDVAPEGAGPQLSVTLDLPDHLEGAIATGEDVRVRARVRASDPGSGGSLTDVRPPSPAEGLAIAGDVTVVAPFEPTAPATLAAGQTATYIGTIRATGDPGSQVEVSTAWQATEEDGDVQTASDSLTLQVHPLQVDVVAEPAHVDLEVDHDGDGDVDTDDHHMDLTVRVTNRSDGTITGITALDPEAVLDFDDLRVAPEEPGTALCLVGGAVREPRPPGSATCFDPETLRPTDRPIPVAAFGDLAPGESRELTYTYEVYDQLFVDASAIVLGADREGRTVRGSGATEISGGADVVARISLQVEGSTHRSGAPVRIVGRVENTTDDTFEERRIAVVLFPAPSGNAGGGYLQPAGGGGRTPTESAVLVLEPGEDVPVEGILATLPADGPTTAEVVYTASVTVLEDEEWVEAREAQVELVTDVDAGIGDRHSVRLDAEPEVAETGLICPDNPGLFGFVDHVSCRFARGVLTFGQGMGDLAGLVVQGVDELGAARWRLLAWTVWAAGECVRALLGDDAARMALEQDIAITVQALKDVGSPIVAGVSNLPTAIPAAVGQFLRTWDHRLQTGDLTEIAGAIAETAGENADMTFDALVYARALKHVLAGTAGVADNAANAALRHQADTAAREIEDDARRAIARGDDPATDGTFPNGVDVTDAAFIHRHVYGVAPRDMDNVLALARAENVQIAFRSRHPRSAALVESGQALPKPMDVKIKTVNEVDVRYLGYEEEWLATVQLVEPPIRWLPPGADRDRAIQAYLDRFPELAGTSARAQTLRGEVAARLETRLDEWPEYLARYSDYVEHGVPVDFGAVENGVPGFLAGFVGEGAARRHAEVVPSTFRGPRDAAERRRFELRMEGPDGGPLRPLTGDVDVVAILNPDGTPVGNVLKRIRIYRQLRSVLGMQHGETFAWLVAPLRDKLLRNHLDGVPGTETLLVAGPDGRARTAKLRDNLSITADGPNAALSGEPDFLLLSGLPHHLVSDDAVGQAAANLLEPFRFYADVLGAGDVAPIGFTTALVDELEDRISTTVERGGDAPACRSDLRGGLECYEPAPDQRRATWGQADDGVAEELDDALGDVVDAGHRDVLHPDPLGRAWAPADPREVLALGDPEVLELRPLTFTTEAVAAGAVTLDVVTETDLLDLPSGSPLFAPGDLLVVGPGQSGAEIVRVARADPLVLSTPLRHGHIEGTTVLLWEAADGGRVDRVAGPGRIETSVEASRDGFPVDGSAGAVVLARGDDFPDALTGTPLAVALAGPLLLTTTDRLDDRTLAELRRVLPHGGTVHLLGGEVALSARVAADVVAAGYEVVRHAGPSRYDTAVVVADALAGLGAADRVVLATGNAAPDALAAGVVAARQHGVVLLTNGDQPVGATTAWLQRFFNRPRLALGGPAATAHPEATAVVGPTRFETARLAADEVPPVDGALAVLASGERFPDALSGGWLAARAGGVIVYAGQDSLPPPTAELLAASRPGRVAIVGGTAAVGTGVETAVAATLGG